MKKIILTGYMASGKTTVAQLLAKASGLPHLDLDAVIETKTAKTIPELFAEKGEIRFRRLEHETLKEVLDTDKDFILSLGGGTPCYANNHEFLKAPGVISFYLKTSIPEVMKRISKQDVERPLLAGMEREEMQEFIAKHIFDRSYFYMQANHVIATDGLTPDKVVMEIMSLL